MKTGLIIEDHPAASAWLTAALLEAYPGIQVQSAATLEEGSHLLASEPPDIALVDLNLPDGNGIDIIHYAAEQKLKTFCIVTTIYDDDAHLFPAIRAGAKGYLLKEQSKSTLASHLRSISMGMPPLSPTIARKLLSHFQTSEVDTDSLTQREAEVLTLIAKGCTNAEAADHLGVSSNTINTHVRRTYAKLGISSRSEATLEAARLGLINTQL